MRRWILPAGAVLAALWIAALWATGGLAAVGTQPAQTVRVQDGFHTQLLTINHNGAAVVTCQTAAGVAESCAGGGAGGGDAVNVFHQSTIRHVSSVLHSRLIPSDNANDIVAMHLVGPYNVGLGAVVAHGGGLQTILSDAGGIRVTVTGTALDVNCTGCAAASVVNVFHVSAQLHTRLIPSSNANDVVAVHAMVNHISSRLHAVLIPSSNAFDVLAVHISSRYDPNTKAIVSHFGALAVTCYTNAGVAETCGGTGGGGDAVNVFHQSTVRHVSSVQHVRLIPSDNANDQLKVHGAMGQSGTWTVQAAHLAGVPSVSQGSAWATLTHAQQSGAWTIQAAHQGGEWNVRHVGARLHVVLIPSSNANDVIAVHATQTGAWNVSAAQSGSFTVQAAHQGGEWNIRHIGARLHAVLIPSSNANDVIAIHGGVAQSGSWSIQAAHQGGQWNVAHVGSRLHVVLIPSSNASDVLAVHATQTGAWNVSAAQSGTFTVQAAHQGGQWNVAHVSARLHAVLVPSSNANDIIAMHIIGPMNRGLGAVVAHGGGLQTVLSNAAGTLVTVTGTSLDVNCTGCSAASVVNVAHISAQLHARLIPSSNAFDVLAVHLTSRYDPNTKALVSHFGALMVEGQGTAGSSAGGVLSVQGVASGTAVIVSQATAANLQVTATQTGTWTVQPGNTANTTAWLMTSGNSFVVAHVSARLHATLIPSSNFNDVLAVHIVGVSCNTCKALVTHAGGQMVAGFGADQTVLVATNTTPFRVAHVTSYLHSVVIPNSNANAVLAMHIQDAGTNCTTCRARVDHYNMLVVQPHISGALRTWQVSQCGTTATLSIATNANRRDLWLMNRGNGNIYIGYGTTGHVALTTANGWPIHATASAITTVARHSTALSTVYLQNYQGPVACISDLAGQTLQVMEILR